MAVHSSQIGTNAVRKRGSWRQNVIIREPSTLGVRLKRQVEAKQLGDGKNSKKNIDRTSSFTSSLSSIETFRTMNERNGESYAPVNFGPSGNYLGPFVPIFYPPRGMQPFSKSSEVETLEPSNQGGDNLLKQLTLFNGRDLSPVSGQNKTPLICVLMPTFASRLPEGPISKDGEAQTSSSKVMDQVLNPQVYDRCIKDCKAGRFGVLVSQNCPYLCNFVGRIGKTPEKQESKGKFGLVKCYNDTIRCANGLKCVSKSSWCDYKIDCDDLSDESRCSCLDRISRSKLCDNYLDCPNGEDEQGCFGCATDKFSCDNHSNETSAIVKGKCINWNEVCNGVADCEDGKDERGCAVMSEQLINIDLQNNRVGVSSGYLHLLRKGKWYIACGNISNATRLAWARMACKEELGTLSAEPMVRTIPNDGLSSNQNYLTEDGSEVEECSAFTHVECPGPVVGSRMISHEEEVHPMVSVVGGRDSRPQAWPFIVGISKNGRFHCGGVILNDRWILTAAHCFKNYRKSFFEVNSGSVRRLSQSPTLQTRHLVGLVIHQDYDPLFMQNDIALAQLNERLHFNGYVRPVRLPQAPSPAAANFGWRVQDIPSMGTRCIVAGWGAISEGGPDPDHLREVEVPIIPCKHPEDISRSTVCAGYIFGGRDSCQGDSGGPLMCRVPNGYNEWYIGGIVSHGIGCGRVNEPGTYTKVSYFVNWINSMMNSRKSPESLSRPLLQCPGFSCSQPRPKCLPGNKRCDYKADCPDAEDEIGCPSYVAMFGGKDSVNQTSESKSDPIGPKSNEDMWETQADD